MAVKLGRVAIQMVGFMRTYERTAPAFLKHLADPLQADIFIFAPRLKGSMCYGDPKLAAVSSRDDASGTVVEEKLREVYGPRLRAIQLHDYDPAVFYQEDPTIPFVAGINPVRVFSFFYHVKKCNELRKSYERSIRSPYNTIIQCRPDIGFFSPLRLHQFETLNKVVYYNAGEGFDIEGKRKLGVARVFPFTNLPRGEYVASGDMSFNDQINILSSASMDIYASTFDHLKEYLGRGVPCNPETLLAYHLHLISGLDIAGRDFVTHEIIRDDTPDIRNLDYRGYEHPPRPIPGPPSS